MQPEVTSPAGARVAPLPAGAWSRLREGWAEAGEGSRCLFTFDLEGRLVEAFVDGAGIRRGLDHRFLERRRDPQAVGLSRRRRRWLSPDEARRVVEQALAVVEAAARAGFPPIRAMDWEALRADAGHFARVYRPIGILPPDQYLSVVVQLTSGCWYNRCTFCTFYRDRPFEVRPLPAFRRHLEEVRAFFGRGLARRHTVFLGDANALVLPAPRLAAYLEAVAEALPDRPVYGFLDAFSGRRKTAADWAALARLGLAGVYIGLESGSDRLLRWLEKPGQAADAVATVRALKEAGVAVGVILLVGAGGRAFADEHVRASIEAVNAMGLGPGDRLYLSPLVVAPGSLYQRRAEADGVEPLSPQEQRAQAEALLAGIRLGRGARWSYYFVEEFLY
ncbi:MAG TPA: radical SAM protein [Limnochordales bacterium]